MFTFIRKIFVAITYIFSVERFRNEQDEARYIRSVGARVFEFGDIARQECRLHLTEFSH